ncbi:MAG: IclR family transcriptional regulator [Tissierellaceae bacterium]|nr:IclR family transcriptional regulator [Tissierellaceae bacterium]
MEEKKDDQNINSIIRAIDILNLYNNNKTYYGITEISKILNLPKSTVFRIVKTLESKGWLIQDDVTNQYKLGFEILNVASSVTRDYSNRDIIIEEMKKLAQEFNENVVLHMYDDYSARCIEKIETQNVVKISSDIGKKTPLHVGATSKIVLAYQKPEIINHVIEQGLAKYTKNTITDKNVLLEDLEQIRRQGYSISIGEIDVGVTAVSVPIIFDKEFLYGLSIVAPTSRILVKGIEEVKGRLLDSTKKISEKIKIIEQLSYMN